MYTECRICRKDVRGRSPLNGIGLGDAIQEEWGGTNEAGKVYQTVAPMLSRPGTPSGQEIDAAYKANVLNAPNTNLLASNMPAFTTNLLDIARLAPIPGIGKFKGEIETAVRAGMAIVSFGASEALRPLISIAGKVLGGLFKKATHMESCMKIWTDSYIRGMAAGVQPYPFSFESYMMEHFPQFKRQYEVMQVGGEWRNTGIDQMITVASRHGRIASHFLRLVKQYPDIMKVECLIHPSSQYRAQVPYSNADVANIWNMLREGAKALEYNDLVTKVDQVVAKWKVKETWGEIVKSRSTASLIPIKDPISGESSKAMLPENVIGVKRGALVMTLKTPQGQVTPIGEK